MAHRVRMWLCLAVFAAASTTLVGEVVSAGAPVAYRASASAEAVRVSVLAVGAPVTNQVVDVATPVAQVALDSTTGSSALASVLYPGDLAVTAPGLVAGLTGGQTSGLLPPYPLLAVAGSTTVPESRSEGPAGAMYASGDDGGARATATSGIPGSGTVVLSTAAEVLASAEGQVTAGAASTVDALTIGPLGIGRLAARSTVTRDVTGELARESTFEVTGASVAGVAVTITPEGLSVAGGSAPLPTDAVQQALEQAGIAVQLLPARDTTDGVISAGLVVTRTETLPTGVSPVTVTYTFGQAVAGLSASALPPLRAGPTPQPPSAPPAAGTVLAPGTGGAAALSVPLGDVSPQLVASGPPATRPVRRSAGGAGLFDATSLYLLLVTASAAVALAIELLRHRGVRTWT